MFFTLETYDQFRLFHKLLVVPSTHFLRALYLYVIKWKDDNSEYGFRPRRRNTECSVTDCTGVVNED